MLLEKEISDLIVKGENEFLSGREINKLQKVQHSLKRGEKNESLSKRIIQIRKILRHQNKLRENSKNKIFKPNSPWGWSMGYD